MHIRLTTNNAYIIPERMVFHIKVDIGNSVFMRQDKTTAQETWRCTCALA